VIVIQSPLTLCLINQVSNIFVNKHTLNMHKKHRRIKHALLWRLIPMTSRPQVEDDGSLPEGRFIGFYTTGDEMSEVVSHCLPHRRLRVSNLSKVATQWLELDSNLNPYGCKAQNIPLQPCVPQIIVPHLRYQARIEHCCISLYKQDNLSSLITW